MHVLGLIPARGGSKGVPHKNIRLLDGRPLLQYTAEAALSSNRLSRVILSTDDEEIAEVGRRCGLDIPFMRPSDLARDDTPMLPVVQHAIRTLESEGSLFDAVCLLQPSSPFREPNTIDSCVEILQQQACDSVVTVLPVPDKYNPHWVYFRDEEGLLHLSTGEDDPIPRRQALPPAFHREGSVYVTRKDVIIEENSLYGKKIVGYPVDISQSVNIDRLEDWMRAERLLVKNGERHGST